MYSLSTCWNAHRHTEGRAMLQEIRDLGFDYAELSHGTRISLLPGILEAVESDLIRISTLHNFCPLPIGVTHAAPNIFQFTSTDARERESAYRYSLKTLETAVRVQAKIVVLHCGSIDMKEYTDRLLALLEDGLQGQPKYEKLCLEAAEKQEQKKERYVHLAREGVLRLVEQAASRGLQLGIENRERVEEVPPESDFPFFLKEFSPTTVGYWHDTGHAQIKENLGFINHAMHLESMADRLIGFHVHDVRFPGQDHCPPGMGAIDFQALKPWVKPEHLKVIELGPHVPVEDVQRGWVHLKSVWGDL
jgi:sugar phosphate isomerase/epimerase